MIEKELLIVAQRQAYLDGNKAGIIFAEMDKSKLVLVITETKLFIKEFTGELEDLDLKIVEEYQPNLYTKAILKKGFKTFVDYFGTALNTEEILDFLKYSLQEIWSVREKLEVGYEKYNEVVIEDDSSGFSFFPRN